MSMNDDETRASVRKLNEGACSWDLERDNSERSVFNKQPPQRDGARQTPLPNDFHPEETHVAYLEVRGIAREFTLSQLDDFKLYWLETGEARKAWQSKFRQHVIYKWEKDKVERNKRGSQTLVEKLTDTSWAEGIDFEE